ncbi:MAG: hypothetical protein ACK5Q5_22760 [Planctomycetaceae bacterium]
MAGEAEIQSFLEQLIGRGELHQTIGGKAEIDRASAAHNSPEFIPNFNLDYLLHIRSVASATSVLEALKDVEIISTSKKNVSSDRKDRLFPDLVLVSKTTGHIIVVEIKRDEQTTREAMTELLAYEQEIRNQMPYLSSLQIMFVLVSDSYPVLLSHAAGQAILWQHKNVLALQVGGSAGAFSLKITLPIGWSSTRLSCVPEHCVQVAELTVRSRSENDVEALNSLVLDMTYEIARAGERSGCHGFVLVSHDHEASEAGRHDDVYTIGIIDPAMMQREVIAESDETETPSPIALYATSTGGKAWPVYDVFTPLVEAVRETLSRHGECQFRRVSDLATWRDIDTPGTNVAYRYSPWAMLFWGLPHVYREALVHHEGLRRMFGFLRRLPSPQDSRIGLFVLDYLTARTPFKDGEFEYESLWRFGRTLGSTIAVLRSVMNTNMPSVPNPDAALTWLGNEILSGLSEVAFRSQAVAEMTDPPRLIWGGTAHAADMLADLEEWVAWFRDSFLAKNDRHRDSFDSGIALHHLYDANLGFEIDGTTKAAMTGSAVKLAKEAYQFAVASLADADLNPDGRRRILRIIERAGLPVPSDNPAGVADERWYRSLPTILGAYDELLPSVLHELAPANLSGTDWAWVKQEVLKVAAGGCRYVAVFLQPDGQLAVSDITSEAGPMTPIENYHANVFTLTEASGHLRIINKATWEEVISGLAFKEGLPPDPPGTRDAD